MNSIGERINHTQIRTLLFISAPIYTLSGCFTLHGLNSAWVDYFRYLLVSFLLLVFGIVLYIKEFDKYKQLPSIFAIAASCLASANVLYQPLEYCSSSEYFLGIIIVMTAGIGASLIIPKKLAYFNIVLVWGLFLGQVFRAEALQDVSILGPIIFFLGWQSALVLKLIEMFDQMIEAKQLSAYHSTIVMLNHELNNVSTICILLVDRMQAKGSAPSQQEMDDLSENITRMTSVIQKLRNVQKFKEVEYTEAGSRMVYIDH